MLGALLVSAQVQELCGSADGMLNYHDEAVKMSSTAQQFLTAANDVKCPKAAVRLVRCE